MTVFLPVDNARTMDFNANDVGYVPAVAGHYIENTGDTVSLNNWLRRLPTKMADHLGLDDQSIRKIPSEKLEVI